MMKSIGTGTIVMMFTLLCAGVSVQAETATTYNRIDEIMDWGAVTSKLIVDLKADVPQGSVGTESFTVHVVRRDERLEEPLLEEGYRTVVDAYISDADGNPAAVGKFATLVMEIGPTDSLGATLNYADDPSAGRGLHAWTQNAYTITQQEAIGNIAGGLVATEMGQYTRPFVERFETGVASYEDKEYGTIDMNYAHYRPAQDNKKHPLIVWLHGGGNGGTDPTIPLAGHKVSVFATEHVQAYFDGAYVLVPQAPTAWWKFGVSPPEEPDSISMYTRAVQDLVERYVAEHPFIDPRRIYVGGFSNGGFMTVRQILDYPDYYAAAIPVCEFLNDDAVSDEELQGIVDLPIWFVTSATDPVIPAHVSLKLYNRLCLLGAPKVYVSYLRRVIDESGMYKKEDGTPHEYNGHMSWIYVYNNDLSQVIDGVNIAGQMYGQSARQNNDLSRLIKGDVVTIMEWLAAQSK